MIGVLVTLAALAGGGAIQAAVIGLAEAAFALIRLLPADGKTNAAIDMLSKNDYLFDMLPVIALELDNRPGALAEVTAQFGEADININYVYGSVSSPEEKCLFVFCPEDIDLAAKIFN